MWAKLLALAALAAGVWWLLSRSNPSAMLPSPARKKSGARTAADLAACRLCGEYREQSALCACDYAPVP